MTNAEWLLNDFLAWWPVADLAAWWRLWPTQLTAAIAFFLWLRSKIYWGDER